MLHYSQQKQHAFGLFVDSLRHYPLLFKKMLPLVLVSALIHVIYPLGFSVSSTVGSVFVIGVLLIAWYLYAAILSHAHSVLLGEQASYKAALNLAKRRYAAMLGGNMLFLIIIITLGLIGYAFFSFGDTYDMHLVFLPIWLIITTFVLVLCYFAVPLIILEHNKVFMAFDRSIRLVWGRWWHSFITLLIMLAVISIMLVVIAAIAMVGFGLATALHSKPINIIYNILSQIVTFPFTISVTLVLLNDLKLRAGQIGTL